MTPQTPLNGPRFNEFIQSPKVRVIDENGENLGVMYTREAMEQAQSVGLDLVEVSPNADPPVAKFLDIGRYKYEAQKKANARNEQKLQQMRAAGIKVDALDEGEAEKKKTASEKKRTGRKNEKVGLPRTGHNRRLADMPFSPD